MCSSVFFISTHKKDTNCKKKSQKNMILENCRNQVQIDRGIGHIKVTKKQNFLLKRLQKNIQIVKKKSHKKNLY